MKYLWKVFEINEKYENVVDFNDVGEIITRKKNCENYKLKFLLFYYDEKEKEFYGLCIRNNKHTLKKRIFDNSYLFNECNGEIPFLDDDIDLNFAFKDKNEIDVNVNYIKYNQIFVINEKNLMKILSTKIVKNFSIKQDDSSCLRILRCIKDTFLDVEPNFSILKIYITSKNNIGAKSLYLSNKKLKNYLNSNHNKLFEYKKFNFNDKKYEKEEKFLFNNINENDYIGMGEYYENLIKSESGDIIGDIIDDESNNNINVTNNNKSNMVLDDYDDLSDIDINIYKDNNDKMSFDQFEIDKEKFERKFKKSNSNFLKIIKLYSMNNFEYNQINYRYLKMVKIGKNFLKKYFFNELKSFWVYQRKNFKGFQKEIEKLKNNL